MTGMPSTVPDDDDGIPGATSPGPLSASHNPTSKDHKIQQNPHQQNIVKNKSLEMNQKQVRKIQKLESFSLPLSYQKAPTVKSMQTSVGATTLCWLGL
jgi:hypothetical protein